MLNTCIPDECVSAPCRHSPIMSSEGVTKIDLHKQPPNQVSGGNESELDKEDFQKAASNAKEAVSNGANNVKEFLTGASNDAANKTSQVGPSH